MKKLFSLVMIVLALAGAALLPGCNTVRGVGQDVQQAGGAIERAANK
jgi:predicted small secreted protein